MGQYKSQYTGPQIDAGINAALNPDVSVTPDSDALVTSGAVADALDNIDPTITSDTDTTLNGILVGNGSKVGTKSLDTSSLTNDADHVPVSSVVKSALDAKADQTDLASIHATGSTNTTSATISRGTYFYLNGALVKAKTDIAVNATFTSGTNYDAVTAGSLNKKTADLLWTNPSPSADFSAQTISLNLSNYSRVLIQYKGQAGDSGYLVGEATVDGNPTGIRIIVLTFGTGTALGAQRGFTASSTGIVVGDSAYKEFPDGERKTGNGNIVPYRIYGII